jgi:phospholipid transport system substrate-binding protein
MPPIARLSPNFIIGTYADRLYDYSDASLKVVRVQNQGANAAVLTQVTKPGGRPGDRDLDADARRRWLQGAEPHGRWRQPRGCARGGFRQLHQRNGFDRLVQFMSSRG